MKYLLSIVVILGVLAASCSIDGVKHESEADINAAREAAKTEATKILGLPEGTMEQENAILAIRARESAIRRAGFNECADTFAAEAQRILMPVLKTAPAVIE